MLIWKESLKKKLEGRNVVFVYLTNETSKLNDWTKQVVNIPGEHYRVSTAVFSQIPNLDGIPQYYLYDDKGQRIWEHTGFGDESLKIIEEEINKALINN